MSNYSQEFERLGRQAIAQQICHYVANNGYPSAFIELARRVFDGRYITPRQYEMLAECTYPFAQAPNYKKLTSAVPPRTGETSLEYGERSIAALIESIQAAMEGRPL